jgi:hypothetical protein
VACYINKGKQNAKQKPCPIEGYSPLSLSMFLNDKNV